MTEGKQLPKTIRGQGTITTHGRKSQWLPRRWSKIIFLLVTFITVTIYIYLMKQTMIHHLGSSIRRGDDNSLSSSSLSLRRFTTKTTTTTASTAKKKKSKQELKSRNTTYLLDMIRNIEQYSTVSNDCSTFGGVKLLESLISSQRELIRHGASSSSSIVSFRNKALNMDIYVAKNVILEYDMRYDNNDTTTPRFAADDDNDNDPTTTTATSSSHVNITTTPNLRLFLNNKYDIILPPDPHDDRLQSPLSSSERLKNGRPTTTALHRMTQTIRHHHRRRRHHHPYDNITCRDIPHPVLLIDNDVDHVNWWWYLNELLKTFLIQVVAEPLLLSSSSSSSSFGYDDVEVLQSTESNFHFERSFTEAFRLLFSQGGRGGISRRVWERYFHHDVDGGASRSSSEGRHRICLRELIWSPGAVGTGLLMNNEHDRDTCPSSIIAAFAHIIKSAFGIPPPLTTTTAYHRNNNNPRVIYVARDMTPNPSLSSWKTRRFITNQPAVVQFLETSLRDRGIELLVADFYGSKSSSTSVEEQARFVSRADIMVGIHGAGLNMFLFMPPRSVVIEIHMSTNTNRNSVNMVHHLGGEGRYLTMNAMMEIGLKMLWRKVEEGIDLWREINSVR